MQVLYYTLLVEETSILILPQLLRRMCVVCMETGRKKESRGSMGV